MKKKILIIAGFILFLGIGFCLGFYLKGANETQNENDQVTEPKSEVKEEKELSITSEDMNTMKKVSKAAFKVTKESLETKDYSDQEKVMIAWNLVGNITENTGTEMLNIFKKYFGKDQTFEFTDIKCNDNHGSEEANIMLKFDKSQDKYVDNDKHPGHGGGSSNFYGWYMDVENINATQNGYDYDVKILFYGPANSYDTGPMSYGNGYKSYNDAKVGQNMLVKIDQNDAYTTYTDGLPIVDISKVFADYKNELDTYTFTFEKEEDNLVFKSYKKKA